MVESPTLRPADPADAAEIARLCSELGYPATAAQVAPRLRTLSDGTRYLVLVAAAPQRRLLGWMVAEQRVSLESGAMAEITGLVVDAKARRQGVGRALVAAAEAWARRRGLAAICVRSNVTRTESHPFYEGVGYRRKKSQHAYVKSLPPRDVAAAE